MSSSDNTKPGTPWTPWARAFGHADGLVTSFRSARPELHARTNDVLAEQVTAVLAYVILGEATERGIAPDDVPLFALHNTRLDPLRITKSIVDAAGPAPATDDPGRAAFQGLIQLASNLAKREEWNTLLEIARTVVMAHIAATLGTATAASGPTVGQRRGQATPLPSPSGASPSASAPPGPDELFGVMPPAIRERLGRMKAAAFSMVLSFLDADPAGVAHHAQEIATYDDRPEKADNPSAGKWPNGRFGFPVKETTRLAADMLDVAQDSGQNPFTNASTARGVRALITSLVPDEHQAAAVAVAEKLLPADDRPLAAVPLPEGDVGIAELLVVAAMAAWLGGGSTAVFPAKELLRTLLIQQIGDSTAIADGVPTAERVNQVSDEQALDFLDDLLGTFHGAVAVNRDPRQRTLPEVNVLAAAKAHLLSHPRRTPDTDKLMLDAMTRALDSSAGTQSRPGLQPDGMTETERHRAEKLAARKGHGKKKGKRDRERPAQASNGQRSQQRMAGVTRPDALAILFLINYLSYAEDDGFDVPAKHFEPQRPEESVKDYGQRREVYRMIKEAQVHIGDWRQSADADLRQIRPEDTGSVAGSILALGRSWCENSGFTPSAEHMYEGALLLVEALSASEYLDPARQILHMLCQTPLHQREAAAERAAERSPGATIHAAAAVTSWLYCQPECVSDADRPKVGLNLGDRAAAYFKP